MVIQLEKVVVCDFCGKSQREVTHMVAGPAPATPAICDACIDLCAQILAEQKAKQVPA